MKLINSKIKILALVLVSFLIIALPVFAFAADEPAGNTDATQSEGATATDETTGDSENSWSTGSDKVTLEVLLAQIITIFFLLVATVVYLMIVIVLIGRWVMIAILAVLSPIPFILMILPATKKFANVWWHKFVKWTFVGVLITFFLWLGPQVLGTKNDVGYWETKTVKALLPLEIVGGQKLLTGETSPTSDVKVIYPEFLGGNSSGADFMEQFIMFCLAVGFMIAAAWVAVTLGETAGKVALGIPKMATNAAKSAGRLAKKGAKLGAKEVWQGSGVPGAAKQRWADTMGKRKSRAEARKEKIMGGDTLSNKLVSEGLKNLKDKGIESKAALLAADRGVDVDGNKLDEFDRVANYIHGADAIDKYDDFDAAKNRMRRLGASEKSIAQFESGVRNSNVLATYDLNSADPHAKEMENARFENDYRDNPEKFQGLLSKQKEVSGTVLNTIAGVSGGKAVKSIIKPYNKKNIVSEMGSEIEKTHNDIGYKVNDDLREVFASETGNLGFAFSKKKAGFKNPVLIKDKLTDFVNKSSFEDLGKYDFTNVAGVSGLRHKINPNTLEKMKLGGQKSAADEYVKKIKTDFKIYARRQKVNKLEDIDLSQTPYKGNSELFKYILKQEGFGDNVISGGPVNIS